MKQLQDWFKIKAKIGEVRDTPDRNIRREYLQELGKLLGDYRHIYKEKFDYWNKPLEEIKNG